MLSSTRYTGVTHEPAGNYRKEADIGDDPKLLLPPVVTEPLYQCATAVVVDKGRCRGQAISVRDFRGSKNAV